MSNWEIAFTYAAFILVIAILLALYAIYLRWEDRQHSKEMVARWDLFVAALDSNNPQDMEKYLEDHKA